MHKLVSVLAFLVFATVVSAQNDKVSQYKKQLSDLKTWVENISNDKFYDEHLSFSDKKTNKEIKFSDLPEVDRRLFQATTAQKLNFHLEKLQKTWKDDLGKKLPYSHGKDDAIAGEDDILKFITELIALRKEALQIWEDQAIKLFKDFPKEFEEKDSAVYLKNIKILKSDLEK